MADLGKPTARTAKKVKTADFHNNITVFKNSKNWANSKLKANEDNDSSKSIQNRKTMQSKIEACFKTFLRVNLKS